MIEEVNPPELPESDRVYIRRQWNDLRVGYVAKDDIEGLHWDWLSGGVCRVSPQPFIHGYIWCDCVRGEISHSCLHGKGPHHIKVAVVKKDNSKETFSWLLEQTGPKP